MEQCGICGYEAWQTRLKRLVRDHNHATGMIRGPLCDDCNQLLGIYEHRHKFRLSNLSVGRQAEYKNWSTHYKAEIEAHLLKDTGVKYYVRHRRSGTETKSKSKIQLRFEQARAAIGGN